MPDAAVLTTSSVSVRMTCNRWSYVAATKYWPSGDSPSPITAARQRVTFRSAPLAGQKTISPVVLPNHTSLPAVIAREKNAVAVLSLSGGDREVPDSMSMTMGSE